jgi:hypothetical protein
MVKQNASFLASFLQVSHLSYRSAKSVTFIYDFSTALAPLLHVSVQDLQSQDFYVKLRT